MISRRGFIGALLAAPAIVRASSLDGLAFLRPIPKAAPLILNLTMNGSNLFVELSDGSVIGPLPIPQHSIPYQTVERMLHESSNRTAFLG